MGIEEGIKVLEEIAEGFEKLSTDVCARADLTAMWEGRAEGIRQAIAVIKAYLRDQPNDPLTLDELWGMDLEVVWIRSLDGGKDMWAFVDTENGTIRSMTRRRSIICGIIVRRLKTYGESWLAYRHKPEDGSK